MDSDRKQIRVASSEGEDFLQRNTRETFGELNVLRIDYSW